MLITLEASRINGLNHAKTQFCNFQGTEETNWLNFYPQPTLFYFHFHSLEGRFDDDDLQQFLDDIQTHRSFQY